MKGICPICEKTRDIKIVKRIEEAKIKGKTVKAEAVFSVCCYCHSEFATADQMEITLNNGYEEYSLTEFLENCN